MNEFEWLRQTRELHQPVAPRDELWARIDAALDTPVPVEQPAPRRARTGWWAVGIAAMLALAAGLGWQYFAVPAPATIAGTAPWKPADPRLAGAALQLDAARDELQQAMQQAPDSPALQRLLEQTRNQQARLRELEKQAG